MHIIVPSSHRVLVRATTAVLIAALVLSASLVKGSPPASASWAWCWDDPTLVLNGKAVNIYLGVPEHQRQLIRGSTLTVVVPTNVRASLTGSRSNNFPLNVNLVRSGTWSGVGEVPVSVSAVINAPGHIPTGLKARQASTGRVAEAFGFGSQEMRVQFGASDDFRVTAAAQQGPREIK